MRKWFIWQWGRGSFQYDVLCGLILIIIFAIPPAVFNDRHDYERLSGFDEVRRARDDDGTPVYTVKVNKSAFSADDAELENGAREKLRSFLGLDTLEVDRVEPVYDTRGVLAAFSFWLDQ